MLGVTNLGALCVAFVEAYLARNISVELSESAYIMKAIGLILLVFFMGIPVIIIAKDNVSTKWFFDWLVQYIDIAYLMTQFHCMLYASV